MGSNKTVLPENKFSGEEDIREFLRDFEIFVAVNEWSDQWRSAHWLGLVQKLRAPNS